MHTNQGSDEHRTKEPEQVVLRAQNIPNLFQLLALDLASCPRFDRTTEYTLACQTRTAWRRLIHSLETQHSDLVRLLGPHLLPSSYGTVSELDIVRLLHNVQVRVDRIQSPQSGPAVASARDWLAQMRADLADFRHCRDEMVRRNLRFVVMLARRYPQSPVGLLDLVQEGTLGLMRAIEKFDPDRGIRFASYAVWWIREAFGRTVTAREETMCLSNVLPGDEKEGSLVDGIRAPEESTPEVNVANAESDTQLYQALANLPKPEADILHLRFGLRERRTYTLREVSQRLGLTREQVRAREQRALVRLRVYLRHPTGDPAPHARTATAVEKNV
jgi:RNA polymerase sigma factor (sigma-70 family)